MRRSGPSLSAGRIAVATAAVYALLLHAFLAGLSPAHSGPLASGICAAAAPLEPGRSKDAHAGQSDLCCLLSCGVGPARLPTPFATPRPFPATVTFVQWTPAPGIGVGPRPKGCVGARGPPVV